MTSGTFKKIAAFFDRGKQGINCHNSKTDIFSDNPDFFSDFQTVFDVGAHHGKVTKKLRQISPKAIVHSFEPFGKSYQVLLNTFKDDQKVILNNAAVSHFIGDASFFANALDETNSLLESVPACDSIDACTKNVAATKVKTITLDSYANNKKILNIDFIKIDTQGNTFEVLQGAENLLQTKSVKWVYAEAEFIEIYKNEKRFSEIELFMRSFDYQLTNLYNMNYTEKGCLAWADALFCCRPTL